MKRKWVKRSDVIILWVVILWFAVAVWGVAIVTLQTLNGAYNTGFGELLTYVAGSFVGSVAPWIVKNMVESTTKNKLNPDYLKSHDDDYNGAA